MDFNIMVVFDIIISILGIYLLINGTLCLKKGEVDPMLVSAEELVMITDKEGFSKYLMPRAIGFGAFCILMGILGAVYDLGILTYSRLIYAGLLVAFLAIWMIFSFQIKKGKEKFVH